MSRSYRQYCGVARALDVVGDRWSLLVVRELLVRPARYRDLLESLPGVPTNLLSERLRSLEADAVIERAFDRESGAVLYRLTPWGAQLRELLDAAVRWSTPLMISGPREDAFRPHWLIVALRALLRGRKSSNATTVGIDVDGTMLMVRVDQNGPAVDLASSRLPSPVLRAPAPVVLGLAAGALTFEQATARSKIDGDPDVVRRVFSPAMVASPAR